MTNPEQLLPQEITAQKLGQALNSLKPILNSSPEDFLSVSESIIVQTANELSEKTFTLESLSILSEPVTGFIPPTTELMPGALTQKGIVLDDIKAYTNSAKYLKSTFNRLKDKVEPQRALFNAAISAAHYGQAEYFDGYDGSIEKRDFILADTVDDEAGAKVSASELKGGAKCLERAAIAHNILTLYGVTSTLETGRLTIVKPDGTQSTENHAFLRLAQPDGKEVIFDVMNPVYVEKEDGTLDAKPSLYAIETGSREPLQADLMRQTKTEGGVSAYVAAQLAFDFVDATAA